MGGDALACLLAQRVRQAFDERFHRRFADIVSGIAWRPGDVLLGAGVDHDPWLSAVDHRGDEGMDAVDHAHQVDPDHAIPDLGAGERVGACLGAEPQEQDRRQKRIEKRGAGQAAAEDGDGKSILALLKRLLPRDLSALA
jgi:hypothetical protein